MNFVKTVIKKIMYNDLPRPKGRWNIDYCNKKMNQKIDLSNEDHCGPCGAYALTKLELTNKNSSEKHVEKPK